MTSVLDEGVNLVVFLEGTSTDGTSVRPFRPGLLEPIVQAGAPVVPVSISYQTSVDYDPSLDVAWWGRMPLLPHLVKLIGIPQIRAEVVLGDPQVNSCDRKALGSSLHQAVTAGLPERRELE